MVVCSGGGGGGGKKSYTVYTVYTYVYVCVYNYRNTISKEYRVVVEGG